MPTTMLMPETKANNFRFNNSQHLAGWDHVRELLLTDNNGIHELDPAGCLELVIEKSQVETTKRCIGTLYQGLKLAKHFNIYGGYVGNRDYRNIFLIDDQHILGIFDNRNASGDISGEVCTTDISTLEGFIEQCETGTVNVQTFIAFEKENLRLANSYERGRQTCFMTDVIYPALLGIFEWSGPSKDWQDNDGNSPSWRFLQELFRNPRKMDEVLLRFSPLWLLSDARSPFNIELDISNNQNGKFKRKYGEQIRVRLGNFITDIAIAETSLTQVLLDSVEITKHSQLRQFTTTVNQRVVIA